MGNEVIPFIYSGIRKINEDILLVISANPETQSVLDCIEMRKNLANTNNELISRSNAIKDKVLEKMGPDGRFVFNTLYSEAYVFDINGKLLVGPYSFIGYNPNTNMLTLSDNTIESPVVEYSLDNKMVLNSENNIDVSQINVDQGLIDGAMRDAMASDTVSTNVSEEILDKPVESLSEDTVVPPVVEDSIPPVVPETLPSVEEVKVEETPVMNGDSDLPPGDNPYLVFGETTTENNSEINDLSASQKENSTSDASGESLEIIQEPVDSLVMTDRDEKPLDDKLADNGDVSLDLGASIDNDNIAKIDETSSVKDNGEKEEVEIPQLDLGNSPQLERDNVKSSDEAPLDLSSFDVPVNNSDIYKINFEKDRPSSVERLDGRVDKSTNSSNYLDSYFNSSYERLPESNSGVLFNTDRYSRDSLISDISRARPDLDITTYSSPSSARFGSGTVLASVQDLLSKNKKLEVDLAEATKLLEDWANKFNSLNRDYNQVVRDNDVNAKTCEQLKVDLDNSVHKYEQLREQSSNTINRLNSEINRLNGEIHDYKSALREYDAIKHALSSETSYSDSGYCNGRRY